MKRQYKIRRRRQYGGSTGYSDYVRRAIPMTPQRYANMNLEGGATIPGFNYGGSVYGYTDPNSIDTGFDWSNVATGAVTGAAAGSVVPGWGTLIGGVVGAGTGAIKSLMGQSSARQELAGVNRSNMQNKVRFDQTRLSGYSTTGNSGAGLYARKGGRIPYSNGGGEDLKKPKNKRQQMEWYDFLNPGMYAKTLNKAMLYPFDVAGNLHNILPNAYGNIASHVSPFNPMPGVNKAIQEGTAENLREQLYYNSPIYFREGEIPRLARVLVRRSAIIGVC